MTDNSIQTKRLEIALEQYERLIFSICYRMVGDYFDAQDVTQETFLTYYKVLERFNGQNEKAFFNKDRYQQMSGFPEAEAAKGNAFRG